MSEINLFRTLMRLLTPEEIKELTTISLSENKSLLTDLLTARFEQEQSSGLVLIASHIEQSTSVDKENDKKVESEVIDEAKKGVVFILDLKKKLEKGQRSLKEKEVYGLYQKAAGLDVDYSKANKDDLKKSSNLGVLVNKKQY